MSIIKINNIHIHYIKSGEGKPIIFLHGIFNDTLSYSELITILGKYYKVFAIDLPMHGKSGNKKNYLPVKDISNIIKK